jgi:hypothetical protein
MAETEASGRDCSGVTTDSNRIADRFWWLTRRFGSGALPTCRAILRFADQQARVVEDTGEPSVQKYRWFCAFEGILKKK